jgi:hypothetical protein
MVFIGGSTVMSFLEKEEGKVDTDIIENTRKGYETTIRWVKNWQHSFQTLFFQS